MSMPAISQHPQPDRSRLQPPGAPLTKSPSSASLCSTASTGSAKDTVALLEHQTPSAEEPSINPIVHFLATVQQWWTGLFESSVPADGSSDTAEIPDDWVKLFPNGKEKEE